MSFTDRDHQYYNTHCPQFGHRLFSYGGLSTSRQTLNFYAQKWQLSQESDVYKLLALICAIETRDKNGYRDYISAPNENWDMLRSMFAGVWASATQEEKAFLFLGIDRALLPYFGFKDSSMYENGEPFNVEAIYLESLQAATNIIVERNDPQQWGEFLNIYFMATYKAYKKLSKKEDIETAVKNLKALILLALNSCNAALDFCAIFGGIFTVYSPINNSNFQDLLFDAGKACFDAFMIKSKNLDLQEFEEGLTKFMYNGYCKSRYQSSARAAFRTRINEFVKLHDEDGTGAGLKRHWSFSDLLKTWLESKFVGSKFRVKNNHYNSYNIKVLEFTLPKEHQNFEFKNYSRSYWEMTPQERHEQQEYEKVFKNIFGGIGEALRGMCSYHETGDYGTQPDIYLYQDFTECKLLKPKAAKPEVKQAAQAVQKAEKPAQSSAAVEAGETYEIVNGNSGDVFKIEVKTGKNGKPYLLLLGPTYDFKDHLKSVFNALWNRVLNGWIVSTEHLETLKYILQ